MTQVNVNINHDNIRNEMAIQIATLITEKAVLAEQVRVLATEKVQLEERQVDYGQQNKTHTLCHTLAMSGSNSCFQNARFP